MKKIFEKRPVRIAAAVGGALMIMALCLLMWFEPWNGIRPKKPAGVKATALSQGIELKWNAPEGKSIYGYYIYLNGKYWKAYQSDVTDAKITGLTGGVKYSVSICVVDSQKRLSDKVTVTAVPLYFRMSQNNPVKTASGNFAEYSKALSEGKAGAVVPGLNESLVPQGLGFITDKKWYVMSYYSSGSGGSMLAFVDSVTGRLVKSVSINDADKQPYKGHAGGVTVSAKNLWIASDNYLRAIPLSDIYSAANGAAVTVKQKTDVGVKASFAMFSGGMVWAGEFYEAKSYPTSESHVMKTSDGGTNNAWLAGFRLDADDAIASVSAGAAVPDRILSIPGIVQGALVLSGGDILLSESYGRGNDSKIERYRNVFAAAQDTAVTVGGRQVPVWFLDSKSLKSRNTLFPMAEGLIERGGSVDVIFESGAELYRGSCKYPLGTLWELKSTFFD